MSDLPIPENRGEEYLNYIALNEGLLLERITFNDWIKHIEEMEG